jgi:tRNA G18 (ribose-2'-O)-methylase SpoU
MTTIKNTRKFNYYPTVLNGGKGKKLDELNQILKQDIVQTIVLGDGINYPTNAATIVRNGSILGLTSIILSSISVDMYNKIKKETPDYADNFLKSFKLQDGKCIYSNKYIKKIIKYSVQHHTCLNMLYNFEPLDVINMCIDNGFTIFMMENDIKGNIHDAKMNQKKVLLIMGNERYGVREEIRRLYPEKINPLYIPTCIDKSSMNVANAAIIGIYERGKQMKCLTATCSDKKTINKTPSSYITDSK